MKPLFPLALVAAALASAGCAQGNLRAPSSYAALAPPPVKKPVVRPLCRLRLVQRYLAAACL